MSQIQELKPILFNGGGTVYQTKPIFISGDRAVTLAARSTNADNAPPVLFYRAVPFKDETADYTLVWTSYQALYDKDGNAITFNMSANKTVIRLCGPLIVSIRCGNTTDIFYAYT